MRKNTDGLLLRMSYMRIDADLAVAITGIVVWILAYFVL